MRAAGPAAVRGGGYLCALLCAWAALGCGRETESRAEARVLLERLQALSAEGSLSQRKSALDALQSLALRTPGHAQSRDVCHRAHLQLLQAEAAQVSARQALSARPEGTPLSADAGRSIAAELERSNDALSAAQRDFPKCEQATLALARETH